MVLAFQAYLRVGEMVPRSGFFFAMVLAIKGCVHTGRIDNSIISAF